MLDYEIAMFFSMLFTEIKFKCFDVSVIDSQAWIAAFNDYKLGLLSDSEEYAE